MVYIKGSIRLNYFQHRDVNKFIQCYKKLCEHFSPETIYLTFADEDIQIPCRIEMAQKILSFSIERKLRIVFFFVETMDKNS